MIDTEKLVKDALDSGKDMETMQEDDLLKGYELFESYTSKSLWIQYLVDGFE